MGSMSLAVLAPLLAVGLVSGGLTGLLGIGGGLVMVPALLVLLCGIVPDTVLMKSCLATAFAVMVVTGSWASWLQYRAGNFDMPKVLRLSPGVALGALLGGASTAWAPELFLKFFFIAFAIYVGVQMLKPVLPPLHFEFNSRTATVAGVITGSVSSLVGVGGGTIVVPYLTACRVDMKRAIGVSTGVGVAVALFSTLGYLASAWKTGVRVENSVGYVNLHVLAILMLACMLGAVVGVKTANAVNTGLLKRMFALLLLGSATKMGWSVLAFAP